MDRNAEQLGIERLERAGGGAAWGAFVFLFSVACYGAFLLVFLYLLAFLGNLQTTPLADAVPAIKAWVSYSIDLGRDMGSLAHAILIDLA